MEPVQRAFASVADTTDKTQSFTEVGPGIYAFTAEGDPNSTIIVGDDGCMVIDTQATPAMARNVLAQLRTVTQKPVKYVVLSHYHAVRTLGAAAYRSEVIIASHRTYELLAERGEQDKASEIGRFPRLFRGVDTIPPGLTWPSVTFGSSMSVFLGKREVRLMHLGAGHTAGDIVLHVPDADLMITGDLVEYHSACYCGDAYLRSWPGVLDQIRSFNPRRLVPGRGDALTSTADVLDAIALTQDFVRTLYGAAERAVADRLSLKDAFALTRERMDQSFGSFAIYEHCLPFNVSRALDEAGGKEHPAIWTAERDREVWEQLQG